MRQVLQALGMWGLRAEILQSSGARAAQATQLLGAARRRAALEYGDDSSDAATLRSLEAVVAAELRSLDSGLARYGL